MSTTTTTTTPASWQKTHDDLGQPDVPYWQDSELTIWVWPQRITVPLRMIRITRLTHDLVVAELDRRIRHLGWSRVTPWDADITVSCARLAPGPRAALTQADADAMMARAIYLGDAGQCSCANCTDGAERDAG